MPNSTTSGASPAKQPVSKNGAIKYPIARLYTLILRWAFRRLYHECAWAYDTVAWVVSRGLWQQWTRAVLPYVKGRTLELGCGTGFVQHALPSDHQPVGFDASPAMLALTQRRLGRTGRRGQLVRGVAQALPFAPATFDTVLATFPSEYILHPDTLAEVQRVLRNDGQWLLVDAPRFTRTSWSIYLIDLAYRRILGTSLVVAQNTSPSPSPYHAIFQRAGMDDSTIHEVSVGDSSVLVMVGKRATQ